MEIEFFIPTSTVRIVSVKINAKGTKYRAYSYALALHEPSFWARETANATPDMSLTYNTYGATGEAGNHTHRYSDAKGMSNEGGHAHSLAWPFAYNNTTEPGYVTGYQGSHTHGYTSPTGVNSANGHVHSLSKSNEDTGAAGKHSHPVSLANDNRRIS